jgi:PAS domain S-box-containing protein
MLSKKTRWLHFIILILLVGCLTACTSDQGLIASQPLAVEGVLDLRDWNFEKSGPASLNGKWEFYWGQLLAAEDFSAATHPTLPSFITVPGSWQGEQVNGQTLSGDGVATYRLTILLSPAARSEKLLALKLPIPINTAHRLYVDGHLLGSVGQVGVTDETTTPQRRPYVVVFAPTGDRAEILLQISSFHQLEGGMIQPILLGTQSQIQRMNELQLGRDLFSMGSIFIMGLYHLVLFGLRRRDKSPLYFGLYCLLAVPLTLLLFQPQVFAEFIHPGWNAFLRTLFVLGSVAVFIEALFFHTLFPNEASTRVVRVLFGLMALLVGLALLVPAQATTALILPINAYMVLSNLYVLWLLSLAVFHQRTEARISLLGYLPLLLGTINDVFVFSQHTQSEPLAPIGLFLFILVQAYLLSARFSRAFTQTEILGEALRHSEAKYRTLFEDSRDLIFITALDGKLEAVNPASLDVLGYTREEALRLTAFDFYASPAERLRFQEAIAPDGAVTAFPVRLRHKAGHELDCQLTATVRHDKTGQVIGYQGIIRDMTAYKQAEAHRQRALALQALNQSLEQRVESRTGALNESNAALQMEIQQRQSHQQEKERLLALAQQQGENLRVMSNWLMEMQKVQHSAQAASLDEDLRQKMSDIRQNLGALQKLANPEHNPSLVTYVSDTLRLLAEVELYVEQVTDSLDEDLPAGDPLAGNPLLQLSSRERQVLKLMAGGKSNPEIAGLLTIRLNTVHTYLKRIRQKLDIQDLPGLVKFARENKLIE